MIEQSTSITELAKALAKSHLQIKNPKKDKEGFHKSKYATLQACINSTRSILAENGLAIMQFTVKLNDETGVVTMLVHNSGEYIRSTYTHKLQATNAQDLGKLLTYLRRYSFMSILNLSAEDDDDDADSLMNDDTDSFVNQNQSKCTQLNDKLITEKQKSLMLTLLEKNKNVIKSYDDIKNNIDTFSSKRAAEFISKYI